MNIPEEQFELILKYVDADLQESEQESFNELMLSSEPFRKELMQVEMIIASIKAIGHKQNVVRVKNIIKELDGKKKEARRKRLRTPLRLGIAATISSLFLIAYLQFAGSNSFNPQSVYEEYYEPYPAAGTFRNDNKLSEGLQLYSEANYMTAIPILHAALEKNSHNESLVLYLASAYMMTEQFAKAEGVLEAMEISQINSLTDQYALWYLGMTQLQLKKNTAAAIQFQKLAEADGVYSEEAKEILLAMERGL